MEQKKKALGRGLEQLFDTEVLDFDSFESNILDSTKESDIKEIPLEEIRSNPYQPRKTFDQNALEELAESIKNYGVFQPIIVKKSIKITMYFSRYFNKSFIIVNFVFFILMRVIIIFIIKIKFL